jgi:hypothetical protein
MNRTRALAVLSSVALLSLAAGCAGGSGGADDGTPDGGGTPSTPGPESVAVYCDTLYDTFATRYAECSKAPLAWAVNVINKSSLCPRIVNGVANGKTTYDRNAAGRCLAFFENATCTELRAMRDDVKYVPDCRAAVVGTGPSVPTTYCGNDAECASGRCYTWSCPGRCSTGATLGQTCAGDRDCAPGFYCFMGAPYAGSTCRPHDERPAENETCTISTGCLPGLYCDGSTHSMVQGTCKPQISSGACPTFAAAMAPGYGCFGGTTQPLLGHGETCTPAPDYCGPGLYCGPGQVCTQDPIVGQTCPYWNGEYQGCIGGYCGPTTHVCIASYPSACYSDWDCGSWGVCDSGCRASCN